MNPFIAERRFKRGAIELRRPCAEWTASDIADSINAMRAEKFDELFRGVRGMSDGEKIRHARENVIRSYREIEAREMKKHRRGETK